MIDTHCHLDFPEFDRDREEAIIQAAEHGVDRLINIGIDAKTSRFSFSLANSYENIYCTVGVHPHDSKTLKPDFLDEMATMAENPKVVGIGEIGLDYYRDLSPRPVQKEAFLTQLELAQTLDLPVVIHVREAMNDAMEIVEKYAGKIHGVFHCFPGTVDQARQLIELGFYISVNGVMTYPKAKMAQVAAEIDLERILIETDCPFLTPVPYRGKRNVPAYVKLVCARLAEVRGIDFAEADKVTTRNAERLFRLVETFG
jgi:TatD DNase family protein